MKDIENTKEQFSEGDSIFNHQKNEKIKHKIKDLESENKRLKLEIMRLTESEKKYRLLLNKGYDAIEVHGISDNGMPGKFIEVNDIICQRLGYTREELLKLSPVDLNPPDKVKEIPKIMDRLFQEKNILFEREHITKNGKKIPVEISAHLFEYNGKPTVLSIARDITERKRVEEEMKRRIMKYKLEDGNIYLVKEDSPNLSLEAFKDLLNIGYRGLIISRTPEKEFRTAVSRNFEFLWLAESSGNKTLLPSLMELEQILGKLKKTAILIERLDYLIFINGFEKTISFLYRLREIVFFNGLVSILSIDPNTLDKKELRLFEKETLEILPIHTIMISADLQEVLRFVYLENNRGVSPSYTSVEKKLKVTKPTARKKIRRLISEGYLKETIKGNSKKLSLTGRGISFFMR